MTVKAAASRRTAADDRSVREAAIAFAVAAAIFGGAEVVLQRIAAPVSAHVALPLAGRLDNWGEFAAGATAALVVVAAAALALVLRSDGIPIAAALAATLIALAAPGPVTRLLLYAAVAGALVLVVLPPRLRGESPLAARGRGAIAGGPVLSPSDLGPAGLGHLSRIGRGGLARTAALAAIAVAVVAGLWPLVVAGGVGAARTVAEAALVAAPILAAGAIVRQGRVRGAVWLGAAVAGGLMAVAVTVRLDTTAMAAVWSVGATLALPGVFYIAAAAAAGLIVATWAADPARRVRLAGVALLAVAGLQPATVHHSLTALVAVALLAVPAGALSGKASP